MDILPMVVAVDSILQAGGIYLIQTTNMFV